MVLAAIASSHEHPESEALGGDGGLDEEELQVLIADDDEEEEAMVTDEEQFEEDKDGAETSEIDANVTFQVGNMSKNKSMFGF